MDFFPDFDHEKIHSSGREGCWSNLFIWNVRSFIYLSKMFRDSFICPIKNPIPYMIYSVSFILVHWIPFPFLPFFLSFFLLLLLPFHFFKYLPLLFFFLLFSFFFLSPLQFPKTNQYFLANTFKKWIIEMSIFCLFYTFYPFSEVPDIFQLCTSLSRLLWTRLNETGFMEKFSHVWCTFCFICNVIRKKNLANHGLLGMRKCDGKNGWNRV